MRFISHRERIEEVVHEVYFHAPNDKGSGFTFASTEDGVIIEEGLNPAAAANLAKCRARVAAGELVAEYQEFHNVNYEPAVIRCDCGAKVTLWSSWASGCDRCGVEYNGGGQKLAPRDQWGSETGERF